MHYTLIDQTAMRDTMAHEIDDLNEITREAAKAALAVLVKYIKPENFDSAPTNFEREHKSRYPKATEADIRSVYLLDLIEEMIVNQTERYRAECKAEEREYRSRGISYGDEHRLLKSELI